MGRAWALSPGSALTPPAQDPTSTPLDRSAPQPIHSAPAMAFRERPGRPQKGQTRVIVVRSRRCLDARRVASG